MARHLVQFFTPFAGSNVRFEVHPLEHEFELSGVKPDAIAVGAVVKLDLLILHDNHGMLAGGAYHNVLTSVTTIKRLLV